MSQLTAFKGINSTHMAEVRNASLYNSSSVTREKETDGHFMTEYLQAILKLKLLR